MINARARLGSKHEREIRDAFAAADWEVLSAPLDGRAAADIIEEVREPFDVAVVGGGDGTIMKSLGAFVGRSTPLGIIPLGTFNDLARALEIPLRPAAAVETIVSGRRQAIDVGCVNGQYFLTEASIGISTHIARRQTPEIKRFLGLASAVATTVTTIWHARPFAVSVSHDGEDERFKTIQLTVANSFHFGGLVTNRTASLDDGKLELYSLRVQRWSDIFRLVGPILKREVRDSAAVAMRSSTRFEVRTRRPRAIVADGEPVAMTPAEFKVLPHAITICVPGSEPRP